VKEVQGRTDPKHFTWITSIKEPGSRLLKWGIKLEEYDYKIIYKNGALNNNADAPSRIGCLREAKEVVMNNREKIELDEETKATILYEFLDLAVGGH
jgi:hypothetical protein